MHTLQIQRNMIESDRFTFASHADVPVARVMSPSRDVSIVTVGPRHERVNSELDKRVHEIVKAELKPIQTCHIVTYSCLVLAGIIVIVWLVSVVSTLNSS